MEQGFRYFMHSGEGTRLGRETSDQTQWHIGGGTANEKAAGDLQGGVSKKGLSSRYYRPLPESGASLGEPPQAGDDGLGLG